MATVLATCVGSGVGQSVIDSLNLVRQHKIVGCDTNRNIYAHHFCDIFFIAPSIYSDEYIDFLINISIKENIDLIIPGHDHELLLLSKNISRFNKKGIKVIVSLPDLIEISRDKYLWYNYFKEYGCAIVPTFRVAKFKKNPDDNIFPAIIKPAGGSASQGIIIVKNQNELLRANDSDIIQPYLFPRKDDPNYNTICKFIEKGKFVQMSEISIQLIFTTESKFENIFISKNVLKSGVPIFVDPIIPDEFEYIDEIMKFIPICEEKKVVGPVNIQGRITEKGLVFFEMNMRFTGITGTRALLGFNEVQYLTNNFLKLPSQLNKYTSNKLGIRQVACSTIPRTKDNQSININVGLTGGSGFIGSYFIRELMKQENCGTIYLFIGEEESYDNYVELYNQYPEITLIKETDIAIESYYSLCDIFVNFASALAFEKESTLFKAILYQYNQTQQVSKANIPLIINISSQSVYNQTNDIEKDENTSVDISNLYAFQKYISEKFFKTINFNSPNSKVISLRFTRVIGNPSNGRKPFGFFANVIDSFQKGEVVELPNPKNKINLLDIRDAVRAILHIINYSKKEDLPDIMNIGGTNISIEDYCRIVLQQLSIKSNNNLIYKKDNKEVTTSSLVNCNLAEKHNWIRKYTIENTINEMAERLSN